MERFKEAFEIRAVRFITKPFHEEEIEEALEAVLREKLGMQEIEVYRDRRVYKILSKEIILIRAYNGYVEVSTKAGLFRKDAYLDTMEEELNNTG